MLRRERGRGRDKRARCGRMLLREGRGRKLRGWRGGVRVLEVDKKYGDEFVEDIGFGGLEDGGS